MQNFCESTKNNCIGFLTVVTSFGFAVGLLPVRHVESIQEAYYLEFCGKKNKLEMNVIVWHIFPLKCVHLSFQCRFCSRLFKTSKYLCICIYINKMQNFKLKKFKIISCMNEMRFTFAWERGDRWWPGRTITQVQWSRLKMKKSLVSQQMKSSEMNRCFHSSIKTKTEMEHKKTPCMCLTLILLSNLFLTVYTVPSCLT